MKSNELETRTDFTVWLIFKYPAWDERDGIPFDVSAFNKRDAIRRARRAAYDAGHTVGLSITDYRFYATARDELAAKL